MKAKYRGFEIVAYSGESLTGDQMVFWGIVRSEDGWELSSGHSYDTVEFQISDCKEMVDEYLANPAEWEA